MSIQTCALQSGSNGNCLYVETADTRLLFDAGISARLAEQRLAEHNRDIRAVEALIISHAHSDHVRAAGVFHRRFSLPVYITAGAFRACRGKLGELRDVRHFSCGDSLQFGDTLVATVPTPHDGAESLAFTITHSGKKLGIFTDLGHRFEGLEQHLAGLDAVYIESNYDPQLLADGPYPAWLKARIQGDGGHLSNAEAAQVIRDSSPQAKLVILSHLSEHNNHPDLAAKVAAEHLPAEIAIALAPRTTVSDMFDI